MVAGCSEGMHWRQLVFLSAPAARAARHRCVGSFALWRPHKERPRAQLFASDAQQLAASSTALWQLRNCVGVHNHPRKIEAKKIG